jgi:DTW domain-containing protein YfiP
MTVPVLDPPDPAPPRRPCCPRCTRPMSVCYCAHLQTLPTRTRILLLQHPREERMAIGTARMAHLSLPNSQLRVATDFSIDPVVSAALAEPTPPYLLFPGAQAVDVGTLPRDRPITLIVVDGTWWQAGKLLKLNPALAALPRVAFTPRHPSQYLIRRQPAESCVSTIEALAEVLDRLERGPQDPSFARLLDPFHAMIATQQRYMQEVRSQRHRLSPPAHLGPAPAGALAPPGVRAGGSKRLAPQRAGAPRSGDDPLGCAPASDRRALRVGAGPATRPGPRHPTSRRAAPRSSVGRHHDRRLAPFLAGIRPSRRRSCAVGHLLPRSGVGGGATADPGMHRPTR